MKKISTRRTQPSTGVQEAVWPSKTNREKRPGWALPLPTGQRTQWGFAAVARGALQEEITEPVDRSEPELWIDMAQEAARSDDHPAALIERLEAESWAPGKINDLLVIARERLEILERYQAVVTDARNYPASEAERVALHCRRDRSGKYGTLTLLEWQTVKRSWRERCAYCGYGPPKLVLEHVRPICCGGKTELANVVPSCGPCNRNKRAKSVEEWLGAVEAQRFAAIHRRRIRLATRLLRGAK